MSSNNRKRKLEESSTPYDEEDMRPMAFLFGGNKFDFSITETWRKDTPTIYSCERTFDVYVTFTHGLATLQQTMKDVHEGLKRLFGEVLEKVSGDLGPNDVIRLCMRSNGLAIPVSTGLLPLYQMTPEKILEIVEKESHPGNEISLNDPFCIYVLTIKSSTSSP